MLLFYLTRLISKYTSAGKRESEFGPLLSGRVSGSLFIKKTLRHWPKPTGTGTVLNLLLNGHNSQSSMIRKQYASTKNS